MPPSSSSSALVGAAVGVVLLALWPAITAPRLAAAVDIPPSELRRAVREFCIHANLLLTLCVLAHVLHGAARTRSPGAAGRHAARSLLAWAAGIMLALALFVCLGAPLAFSFPSLFSSAAEGSVDVEVFGFWERLALASSLSAWVLLPPFERAGLRWREWQRVFFLSAPLADPAEADDHDVDSVTRSVCFPSLVSLCTSALASMVLPLDAGTRWQVFPLSKMLGAAVGFLVASAMGQGLAMRRGHLRVH